VARGVGAGKVSALRRAWPARDADGPAGLTAAASAGTLRAFFNPTPEAAMHKTMTLVLPAAFAG
jgi:hypothetical protein